MMDVQEIISIIKAARLSLSTEKQAQNDLESVFSQRGIKYVREPHLSQRDIPDFMVGSTAIEMKLRGARKKEVFKQLCRYAESDKVTSIILVSNLTMGLPENIEGKPVYFVSMGGAWL